jgi:hypothetical protein
MNTLKIVMAGDGHEDRNHYFSGFRHMIMERGTFKEPTEAQGITVGDLCSRPPVLPDKIITSNNANATSLGCRCKLFTLDVGDGFLHIATTGVAYLLSDTGKTIEAMY